MIESPGGAARTTCIDGLEISWDDRVLEPRPWTRRQAEWAIQLHRAVPPGPVLELCSGVGHIGLWTVRGTGRPGVLVDADPVACEHARDNAHRAGLARSVRILEHRIDGGQLPGTPAAPLVLADPPYLPSAAIDEGSTDPRDAVDGGGDGLALVSVVLHTAAAHLAPGGVCLLQVRGERQAVAVSERLAGEWSTVGLRAAAIRTVGPDRAVQLLRRSPPARTHR